MSEASSAVWRVAERIGRAEQDALGVDTLLLAQLLWNRGVRSRAEAEAYLEPERAGFGDPYLMLGIPAAVTRVLRAIGDREQIVVYGDYDVDGVAGAALLCRALQRVGADVAVHIPDRARDGYGVHAAAVRALASQGGRVIITVDCGVSANEPIALARELGIDVIVTDHHTVPTVLPAATAVLNPHQPGCRYPFKDLAGGGVAFQLARALLDRALPGPEGEAVLRGLAPLAALSTVADVVPLVGENRTLVHAGVEGLRRGEVPGVQCLTGAIAVAARDLAFRIIPRLNAAGRMGDARDALALLLAPDATVAAPVAARLEEANALRRQRMEEILASIELEVGEEVGDSALVLHGDYPIGLAGLLAARLADRYGVACAVIEDGPETSRGSVRGGSVHLVRALEACERHLLQYGGHARAAGFSLATAAQDAFRAAFIAAIRAQGATVPEGRVLEADAQLLLSSVRPDLADLLQLLEPVGAGNPAPCFVSRRLDVLSVDEVRGGHLRLVLAQGRQRRRAIAFRPSFAPPAPGSVVDVLYEVERTFWEGEQRVELRVHDLRPSGA